MTDNHTPLATAARTIRRGLPPQRRRAAVVGALAVSAGLLVLLGVLGLVRSGEVLPGVTVAGIPAGGMSADELREALTPVAAAAAQEPVLFVRDGEEFQVTPSEVGFAPSVETTVDEALAIGRGGNPVVDALRQLAFWSETSLPLQGTVDGSALDIRVGNIAAAVDREPFPGALQADPTTLTVTTQPPREGLVVRRDATRRALADALVTPGVERLDLPVETRQPSSTQADVDAVAATARNALQQPAVLDIQGVDEAVELSPPELAPLLGLAGTEDGAGLTVDPDALHDALAGDLAPYEVPARDATWTLPDTPPVSFDDQDDAVWEPVPVDVEVIPGETGRELDVTHAATVLANALGNGSHRATTQLHTVEPSFTTEQAEAFGISELVSTFTTYHAPGENRVINIHQVADVVDGTRVAPGEQFSINQLTGERTCAKGYAEDAMILNGELVDVCGGGVSQFGTTTMNAAFFAGVPLDQFKAHSHYISRYPRGREATLNYPSPDIDVRFTNDTGKGMVVRTSYTATSITVSIYGTSLASQVRAVHGEPTNYRDPPVEYVEDKALPPQTSRVVEPGATGFDITVTRIIEWKDGGSDRDTYDTRYVATPREVHRNTDPKPEPTPSPQPSEPRPSDPEASPSPKPQQEQQDQQPSGGETAATES